MAKRRGRNEGSIWEERGNWRAAISLDGHRVTKTCGTKEECKAWIRGMQNEIDLGLTFIATQVTMEEYIDRWLSIHTSRLRQKTGPQYKQLSRDYIVPNLGKYRLRDLRVDTVETFYQLLLKKGVGVRTVRYVHSVLHRCLNDAVKRGIIGVNPTHGATLPRYEHDEMKYLFEDQALQFLITARQSRFEALYHLAIKTGMRQGELLGLKWNDLDLQKGTVGIKRQLQRISGQGLVFSPPKTKAGRRTIQLGEQSVQILHTHRENQMVERVIAGERWQEQGLIFTTSIGTPFDPRSLLRNFKALLKLAGLDEMRFHDLRHTAASLMLNNGVPILVVTKILGHSKPSTTLDIYGHLVPVMQEEAARIMDGLITPIPVDFGNMLNVDVSVAENDGE